MERTLKTKHYANRRSFERRGRRGQIAGESYQREVGVKGPSAPSKGSRQNPKQSQQSGTRSRPLKDRQASLQATKESLRQGEYVVFDIETTGGNPSNNGITEICAVKLVADKVVDQFYTLVNPKQRIPPIVRRMTGIDNTMLYDAPTIEKVMPKLLRFCGHGILVSHITIGDLKFIRYYSSQVCHYELPNFFLCTHLLGEKLLPEARDKSLQGLAEYVGGRYEKSHRAQADTEMTVDLFAKLRELLLKRGIVTIEEAIRFQGDFDSGLRLGWGMKHHNWRSLHRGPGLISFFDSAGDLVFSTSSPACHHDFRRLSDLGSLPKQLAKTLFKATDMALEPLDHLFTAMVKEAQTLGHYSLKHESHRWHSRSTLALCFILEGEHSVRVKLAQPVKGTIAAFGPVGERQLVLEYLQSLATTVGFEFVGRNKGLVLDKNLAFALLESLTSLKPRSHSFSKRLTNKIYFLSKKTYKVPREIRQQFMKMRMPREWSSLLEKNGVVVIKSHSGQTILYPVVASAVASKPIIVDSDWKEWLLKSRQGRYLRQKMQFQRFSNRWKVVSHQQALLTRVFLWFYYATKSPQSNEECRYYSFDP